jgi:hypothetical protein
MDLVVTLIVRVVLVALALLGVLVTIEMARAIL